MGWLRQLLTRRRRYDDLAVSIREHLEEKVEELVEDGLPRAEAERAARRAFGNVALLEERGREAWQWPRLESLWADARYALRQLARSPAFAVTAILTIALGIGANVAVFALVRSTLLEPLPVRAADRLVVIWIDNLKNGWSRIGPSGQDYLDWREQNAAFPRAAIDDFFLFEHGTGTVTGAGEPEQVAGLRVTTNFGDFFGIKPVLGRTFRADEAGAPHNLVLLSYGYWRKSFHADPAAVGRGLTLNGVPYTIIGVLPAKFSALFPIDLVVPFDDARLRGPGSDLGVFARLRKGATVAQASSEMDVIMRRIAQRRPLRKGYGSLVVPLAFARTESIRSALLVLAGAVGFVLLIACANVTNLLLSRAVARGREMAVRMALGAGRARLMQQLVVEGMALALLGGCGGLMMAMMSRLALARFLPSRIFVPNAADQITLPPVHLDGTAVAFAGAVSLLAGVVFGGVSAWHSMRTNVHQSLKEGERHSGGGPRKQQGRALLIVIESALAFVLVVGAGLMLKSFSRLLATDPGFQQEHLLTMRMKLPNDARDGKYASAEERATAFRSFQTRVEALPGVQSAAFGEILPLSQDDMDMGTFVASGAAPPPTDAPWTADYRDVTPGYFRTMGIPLLRGRGFTNDDNRSSPRVVVIDASLARHLFPGKDPIGRHLQVPNASGAQREIVGVAGSVLETGYSQQPRPMIYFPSGQEADQTMSLVVRTELPEGSILPAIKQAIWSVDRNQPVLAVRTMNDIVAEVTSAQRVASFALDALAALALLLAAIGMYGVTAYNASQRIHEIGVRMALGAQRRDVMLLILGQGMRPAAWGLGAGLLASVFLTRLMGSLLYKVNAADPATYALVGLVLVLTAAAASLLPARRAMRIDPMKALRME